MSDDESKPVRPPAPAGSRMALPPGFTIDGYRVDRIVSESASAIVYAATDVALGTAVALKEFMPSRLARRDAAGRVIPFEETVFERGLQAFFGEARALARCDHPSLLRVTRFVQANGTAYRVMPWAAGTLLVDVRRDMFVAPDEPALRLLMSDLLGALAAFHATGQVHGAVTPANILLLGDDRPLLLGPAWASRKSASELIESLMVGIAPGFSPREQMAAGAAEPQGPWTDLYSLAAVLRFCITGQLPAPDAAVQAPPHWTPAQRSAYSAALLAVIDAALSPAPQERPQDVAQFREWLEHMPSPADAAAAAEPDFGSLIERVLQGVPERAEPVLTAPEPESPPFAATPAPQPTADDDIALRRAQEEIALTAPPEADDGPPRVVPPPPRRALRRTAIWGGSALVVVLLGAFVLTVMRDERRTLRVAWPPDTAAPQIGGGRTEAERSAATRALPDLPSAPPAAGPAPTGQDVLPAAAAPQPAPQQAPVQPSTQQQAVQPTIESPSNVAPTPTTSTTAEAPAAAPAKTATAAAARNAATPAPAETRSPAPVRAADANRKVAANPRDLCEGRTPFATYRCMQTQCAKPQWTDHAQCKRLRATDSIDDE